jgi:hypothetical protein
MCAGRNGRTIIMSTHTMETKGFFAGLFDFGFTSFITLKFLRIIYALVVALILLVGLIALIAGLSQGGATAVASILLVPLGALLYLVFTRVTMEVIALFFRIGENTSVMAAAATGQAPPPATPGYGQPGGDFGGAGGPGGSFGSAGYGAATTITPDQPEPPR